MDQSAFQLGQERMTPERLYELSEFPNPALEIPTEVEERVRHQRAQLEQSISGDRTVYGVNTGFGYLSNTKIETEKLQALQENIIRSHASGVGDPLEDRLVRGLMVLRLHTLLLGHSAITIECAHTLRAMIGHDILPVIPCQGSVGASGDLAPLAHLALAVMGEGQVRVNGERMEAADALENAKIPSFRPSMKEGLTLVNGTQFMTAIAAFAVVEAKILAASADPVAALSLQAIRGSSVPFDARIHKVRPHRGQQVVAAIMNELFDCDDEISASHRDCDAVQDPYSFRCVPQVHGATRDVIRHVEKTVTTEMNSITDNPLLFDEETILSGGNFHGQPIALAVDYLAIAVAELGSISERRTEKITNPSLSRLPPMATQESGLNSGFMIPHVVAAAVVSENKILCHPASVDSIPTSADKEDHVSMGPIGARKARKLNHNVSRILAIELLTAAQGVDLLAPLRPARTLQPLYDKVRERSATMAVDRSLSQDIESVSQWIRDGGILDVCKQTHLSFESEVG